jgi:histidine triad (HIT) family protein
MTQEEKANCLFCDIIAGKKEAYPVFEDETSLCILDIHPFARGHCLIIPKRHVIWWHELTTEETGSVFRSARTIANRMMKAFSPEFVFMYAWGLRVPHAHIHLIPSTSDDVFDRFFLALEKFQEAPQELAHLTGKEQMLEAMRLLLKTEYLEGDS